MSDHVKLDKEFTIRVFPAEDVPGAWLAEVSNADLEEYTGGAGYITQGSGPVHTVAMAAEMLALLSDTCLPLSFKNPHEKHCFCKNDTMDLGDGLCEPCIGCCQCNEKRSIEG